VFVVSSILSGCEGAKEVKSTQRKKDQPDARELYRTATDATEFRVANERANALLAGDPEAITRHYPGAKDKYQKFLETAVGLDKAEIDEVNSSTFTLLDAHYLEGCFLLREIARSLPLQGLSPLQQAEYCFGWVMRHVFLENGRDELLPPPYVLRRGQGNAAERAWVFLALLQQVGALSGSSSSLKGCLIALPVKNGHPRPWLAGVLLAKSAESEQPAIYLFEPRLGLPVPGLVGKRIGTLEELLKNPPALLDFFKSADGSLTYDVDGNLAKQAEIRLVFPLSGLSARMRYLQDELFFGVDPIGIAVRGPELYDKFSKLGVAPVHVWIASSAKGGALPTSPTLALRQFLPPEEGGVDKSRRLERFRGQVLPGAAILQGFADEKLSKADLPVADAEQKLGWLAQQVWMNYIDFPRQELLRGRLDDGIKRLVRIQKVLDDSRTANLDETQIAKWRQRVMEAYRDENAAKIAEIWGEDQWLLQLVNEPEQEPGSRQLVAEPGDAGAKSRSTSKKLLSEIVFGALYEPLHAKCTYLIARRWQEISDRLQAQLRQPGFEAGARGDKARQEVNKALTNADAWWASYEQDNPLTVEALRTRLAIVKKNINGNRYPLAVGLLEYHGEMFREGASGRLQHARVLEQLGQPVRAKAMLKKLSDDLEALANEAARERPLWTQFINTASAKAGISPVVMRQSVDNALVDLGPTGSLFWPRYTASLKAAEKTSGER
jgi:hypothetical protein